MLNNLFLLIFILNIYISKLIESDSIQNIRSFFHLYKNNYNFKLVTQYFYKIMFLETWFENTEV